MPSFCDFARSKGVCHRTREKKPDEPFFSANLSSPSRSSARLLYDLKVPANQPAASFNPPPCPANSNSDGSISHDSAKSESCRCHQGPRTFSSPILFVDDLIPLNSQKRTRYPAIPAFYDGQNFPSTIPPRTRLLRIAIDSHYRRRLCPTPGR